MRRGLIIGCELRLSSPGRSFGAAALVFGVPLGIVVGRWVWILLAVLRDE